MLAFSRLMAARKPKVHQGIEAGVGHRIHMASASAVAAIGAPKLFVLFVPKRDAAVPTVTGDHVNQRFVHELHKGILINKKAPTSRGLSASNPHIKRV
jgi:hypothetical protein